MVLNVKNKNVVSRMAQKKKSTGPISVAGKSKSSKKMQCFMVPPPLNYLTMPKNQVRHTIKRTKRVLSLC